MINQIEIKKLFGRFDYSIEPFPGGITIITGPNGFGKSTILRVINAISSGRYDFFYGIEFERITVVFVNEKKTVIEKKKSGLVIDGFNIGDSLDFGNEDKPFVFRHYLRPKYLQTGTVYFDRRSGETLSDEELFTRVIMDDDFLDRFDLPIGKDELNQFRERIQFIKESCGEVRYISDQRLIKANPIRERDENQVIDVIGQLPEKIKKEISVVVSEYSQKSAKLDSTYPKRLFSAKEGIISQDDYVQKLQEANQKVGKLREYSLVDISLINEKKYNEKYATALKIYFDDFFQKYEVFEKLIQKLDLFTKIINNRLLFKRIRITQKNGFEVIDADNPNKTLALSQLSSGEKQEIVLFYELIFETREGLLLLIDEPEISLHIIWQKFFLDDLIEVSKMNKFQAIIATHSPQIIAKHLDIQVDLCGLYDA